ncbi:MAG: hypothetical protein KJ000_21060 [Pirellulaceae bacterium]|nr:hypothetical protein [Pirellulaceae bacterium]
MQAENGRVYTCFGLEATKILEQTVREVVTEAIALLLVEQGTFNQIAAGLRPKLDAHPMHP